MVADMLPSVSAQRQVKNWDWCLRGYYHDGTLAIETVHKGIGTKLVELAAFRSRDDISHVDVYEARGSKAARHWVHVDTMSKAESRVMQSNPDGTWSPATPIPFQYGAIPLLLRFFTRGRWPK